MKDVTGDEIKPALTAEEWAHVENNGKVTLIVEDMPSGNPVVRHGAAALCLHGQPFGFTHEDVDLLKGLSTYAHPKALEAAFGEHVARRLDSLRARIAALLPPRQENG